MPRKDKVIHISNLPSTFRGNVTRNGRFIQNGISPLGGAYDKVAKSTGLIRLGNEFLYNGVNNLVSKDNREKLMNNTAGRFINYVKDFNKESFPSDDELGPTFPFNIIQTPRSNGKKLPQKQYAVGGKIPNVVAGGIAQPLGNNFFYMNGRKHSQGGIDIGPSDKTGIEVEDGEVVETNGNELKVYSAQPIINGVSPAKLIMGGANPNKVFKAQEDFKDRNGINDDGTKAKFGKEKHIAKSDNTRVTPIMESSRNSGIKQGDFIYYPETYRIVNNTLEKVPARKEINMTPLEQINPEFDILLGGAGVLRGVDKATKVAIALDKNISRTSQKAITKGRDALSYYSISPNIHYNLSVNNGRKALGVKPTKLLEAPKKQLTSNIGKYKDFVNVLDSDGKVIDIPDVLQTNIDDTRAFLKTFNKWNTRYGYEPIPLSAAKNPKQADKLIKDRLLEHNTFIRGVHETGNEENINNILRRNGIEPTPNGYLELQYAYDIARKRGINSSTYSIRYDDKDYKILDYIDDNFTDYQTIDKIPEDEVKAIYYNNVNNKLGKLLSKNYRKYVEKQFNKQYRKAINKEIAKNGITDDELKEYIESKGIHPEHKKYNVITSEKLVKSSRNEGNPYQHFIFTGDVGKQGFEVIDIVDVNSDKFKRIPYTRDHFGKYTKGYSRKSRKLGGKNMIVSISGNVKNGLIHSPSSTGSLRDKFAVGGKRINRHGRTWEYDEQNGYYVPITNRTINRTSAYPINKSARGETIVGSDYTFRNGRWSKNNTTNNNTNKSNIDNGNRRPQYYAERRLPLFEDGAGITSGLVRAGWSHGNDKGISTNNTNIPSLSETKSSGKTPRGERSKSSQSTQSISIKTPPTAVYNRNLPKVEASIPTTLPVSTNIPAQEITSSDGKGQGRFKNLTTADWIGLGSNVAGSLASYFASKRAINKMRGPGQPTLISANKLKTKYNINPQLDRIREDKFEAYRDIDSNTASSRVSLARKQRVRNAAGQAANELYGNKENIETNLINQDRRNQQSVRQFNAQQYNQYIDRKAAFDNGIREAKVTNINNLFSGINAGIQDMISRYENRKALNNTIGAMRASAPNVDDRIMRDAGVDYDEFIIRKRRKLGGKQSCR